MEERSSSARRQHGQLAENIRARQDHFERLLLKLYDKISTFEDLISRVEQQEQLQMQSKRRERQLRENCRDLSVELAGMAKNLGLLSETHDDLQRQVSELVPESRRLSDHTDRAQQALQMVQVRQEDALEAATGKATPPVRTSRSFLLLHSPPQIRSRYGNGFARNDGDSQYRNSWFRRRFGTDVTRLLLGGAHSAFPV